VAVLGVICEELCQHTCNNNNNINNNNNNNSNNNTNNNPNNNMCMNIKELRYRCGQNYMPESHSYTQKFAVRTAEINFHQ
jgi:hypothetical protein